MNDDVFSTIAAVALLCGSHLMSGGSLDDNLIPVRGSYESGFEKCDVIVAAYRAEMDRREKAATKEKQDREKERVVNALAALSGKKFTPEPRPKEHALLWGNLCDASRFTCITPVVHVPIVTSK